MHFKILLSFWSFKSVAALNILKVLSVMRLWIYFIVSIGHLLCDDTVLGEGHSNKENRKIPALVLIHSSGSSSNIILSLFHIHSCLGIDSGWLFTLDTLKLFHCFITSFVNLGNCLFSGSFLNYFLWFLSLKFCYDMPRCHSLYFARDLRIGIFH